jgi:SAM-dependent methyltransferase
MRRAKGDGPPDMGRFWDARAREDAFFFVDDHLGYGNPDVQRLWAQGRDALQIIFDALEVAPAPTDTVLDLGCGLGRLSRELARRAQRVIAVDVSGEMLERARELNSDLGNVTWLQGDGTSLGGIEDAAVDACVSHVVFQHIPDPEITYGYVREIGRVLRPGGWAAFQVSNDPGIHRPHGGLRRTARKLAGREPRGRRHAAWVGSAVDLDALGSAAADGAMRIERTVNEGTQYCLVLTRRG